MSNDNQYDVAIVGGGLAGLALAVQLAAAGRSVVLFEKETYPFHKVCGEYISLESWDYLVSLGLPLDSWHLPIISRLAVSSPNGTTLRQQLPLGGFGVSRYRIDHELRDLAVRAGATMQEATKVNDIVFDGNRFSIQTDKGIWNATVCCAATGKRSNLDVKWKRPFVQQQRTALNNYIGVKYHAMLDHPRDEIALHNFKDGYCGISPVEENKTCICYLTTAANLRNSGNNIREMERTILEKNHYIKETFSSAKILYSKPLSISQISFEKKEQYYNHVLLLGDAAGMITPLCGNGMSMALFSAQIAARCIGDYFSGKANRDQMETDYAREWKESFARRLRTGRALQSVFGKEWITNATVGLLKHFPGLVSRIIRETHGHVRREAAASLFSLPASRRLSSRTK